MKTLNDVLNEMFLSYVRSENFVNLNEAARNEFVEKVEQLKELAASEK